jgi:hypothetical protein
MDDKFLYQLRERPDSEFAENLQKKLTPYRSTSKWRMNMNFQTISMNTKVKLVWLIALIMVSLLAVTAISPARAFVSSLLSNIARQSFEVTENYPEYGGGETIVEPQVMSLLEASAIFPHNFKLPTNVPNEFTLDEDNVSVFTGMNVGSFADTIVIQWKPTAGAYLTLYISNHDWSTHKEVVAPDSIEEILLDYEHSAVLIKGVWDADKKIWDDEMGMLRIRWQVDDLAYDLHGYKNNITAEQLVEIALSTFE